VIDSDRLEQREVEIMIDQDYEGKLMPTNDPFALQRFLDAQARFYPAALTELKRGQKRSHWMWFVFPQAAGLGHSPMAQQYAIRSRGEAEGYLAHPLLGQRLYESVTIVLSVPHKTALQIFGAPDDLKLRSCLTLFETISSNHLFRKALDRFFDGRADQMTHEIVRSWVQ
jgi:uncharacterized protein (DUF1810 family)